LAIFGWASAYLPFAVKYPRLRMPLHADAWIVVDGFWGGQQNDRTAVSEFRLCPGYEFPADALPLEITVNGKVGKVAAVVKVRDGPGNAHKGIFIPCGNSQIPVLQHSGNARRIIHRPPLCQAGSLEYQRTASSRLFCIAAFYPRSPFSNEHGGWLRVRTHPVSTMGSKRKSNGTKRRPRRPGTNAAVQGSLPAGSAWNR
jgi:hypothetical protein